jgi:hypothetical protein
MTNTLTTPTKPSPQPRDADRKTRLSTRPRRSCRSRTRGVGDPPILGRYTDSRGRRREVVVRDGAADSALVIDRERVTHGDARLIAHLAADEPAGNAQLVCRRYLQDVAAGAGRCRLLTKEDMEVAPFADHTVSDCFRSLAATDLPAIDRRGFSYALRAVHTRTSIPQLRWCRSASSPSGEPVSVREAIAGFDSYEPVRSITTAALVGLADGARVSTAVLRAELARVHASPIVLNRGLREAVLRALDRERLSMSEIAIRCGRTKRDRRGNEAGETSWLARRIGLLPEGGHREPTPWIHSDVLALIARRGLGISPREVEL